MQVERSTSDSSGKRKQEENRFDVVGEENEGKKTRQENNESNDSDRDSGSDSDIESEDEGDSRGGKTRKVIKLMKDYFGEAGLEELDINNLIDECFQACDRVVGEAAAVEWSKDSKGIPFKLDIEICAEDISELQKVGGDLRKLVEVKQQRLAEDRFSVARVLACVPRDDPDFARLIDIAGGVELVVREDFEPSNRPRGPLRQSYLRVQGAVNKTLSKSHEEGLNIMLPMGNLCGKPKVNFISIHWAENGEKPEGRTISDSSVGRNMRPEWAVNSKEGKEKMKIRWGELVFPSIHDLARMILQQVERVGWERAVLWKADIRSAYGQMFVAAKDATLLTTELTNGIGMVSIVSGYGFTGTGYAFGPLSRVIKREVEKTLKGGLEIYCDDLQGACAEEELEGEKRVAYSFIERLLGPRAFAGTGEKNKYKAGRTLELIGWEFDLDRRVVGLASRNYKKTLYEFFVVDVQKEVSLRTMERLAAFASRYCLVARPMRPFVHHLHAFKNTFSAARIKSERKKLTAEARLDILMWRTFLVMMGLKRGAYWRKIESFSPQVVTGLLKYDSCLKGLGLRLYRLRANGGKQLIKVASIITPYKLKGQSRYQNTMEFSSVAVGFLIMAEEGWRDIPLKIVGDSKASETWCAKERFKSTVSRGAAMMYMTLGVEFGYWVEETEFVEGKDNKICDALSRRSETDEGNGVKTARTLVVEMKLDPAALWEEKNSPFGEEMIELCNPLLQLDSDETFSGFAVRMHGLVNRIKNRGGSV